LHIVAGWRLPGALPCIWLLYKSRFVPSARNIACVDRDWEVGWLEWRDEQGCADLLEQRDEKVKNGVQKRERMMREV
jgi:hypothetical protein